MVNIIKKIMNILFLIKIKNNLITKLFNNYDKTI